MKETLCGRPLIFGDIEQIAAINSLRVKEEEKELREKKMAAGELVEFEVDLRVEGTLTVTVEASITFEFELILLEDFDALARTCTSDGRVIEVSGFEAPQAAGKLRTA